MRIVTSWLSTVTGNAADPSDTLTNNYDLFVYTPNSGQYFASSASATNNFEIVEFVAPETGQYRVEIYNPGFDLTSRPALAWTRLAAYAPDVRTVSGGWNSTLYVRNDDALARSFTASFYNDNGALVATTNTLLNPRRVWTTARPPAGVGAAVVDGSEYVSVAVASRRTAAPYLNAAYAAVPSVQSSRVY